LVAGGAWFGGTVLLAVLLGLSLPARQALVWVVVVTALSVAQLTLIYVPAAQASTGGDRGVRWRRRRRV
jgi:hypothetical protein